MKTNKIIFFTLFLFIAGFLTFRISLSYFSDSGTSSNNVLSASAVFPSATPSNTPTPPPASPTPQIAQTLVMNEIMPHSGCTKGNAENQWVELWNGTSSTINLQNFKLSDGTTTIAISNSSTNLSSHAFAILIKDNGFINQCNMDVHGAVTPNLGGNVNLNTGILRLLDSGDNVVDTVLWGTSPNPTPAIDQSIERSPLGLDTALGTNFTPSDFVIRSTSSPGQ